MTCPGRLTPSIARRRSPRKNEKRPVYVLNISLPQEMVDMCIERSKHFIQVSVRASRLIRSEVYPRFQDSDQLTKSVIVIVRAFLIKHGFAKNRVNTACEEGNGEVINPSPTRKKRKRDWTEAPLPTESSFPMNTTASTESGRSQTYIDPTEYTKYGGATIIHAVCVSAAQSCS